jgi:hypothetical protein
MAAIRSGRGIYTSSVAREVERLWDRPACRGERNLSLLSIALCWLVVALGLAVVLAVALRR